MYVVVVVVLVKAQAFHISRRILAASKVGFIIPTCHGVHTQTVAYRINHRKNDISLYHY